MLLRIYIIIYVGLLCFSIKATPIGKRKRDETTRCPFDTIIIFGDSTCDNGNTWKKCNYTYPVKEYYQGRFSNGPTWVEYLSKLCNAKEINNAYGGATSDSDLVKGISGLNEDIPIPGVKQQVEEYLSRAKTNSIDFDKTLYIIGLQGNDYLNDPSVSPWKVVKVLYEQWVTLVNLGGKNILINRFFYLKNLPYVQNLNAIERSLVGLISKIHNNTLKLYVGWFKRNYDNVKLFVLPIDEIWDEITKSSIKDEMGLSNFKDGCVVKVGNNFTVCQDPDAYFFWDFIHPSTKVHKYVGTKAYKIITEE